MNTIGMEPVPLKKDYGNEIVSPGGGQILEKCYLREQFRL